MKKLLFITVIIVFTITKNFSFAQDKIAVVNINKILQKLPQIIIVEKNIEHEFKIRSQKLQDKEKALQKKVQILQRDNLSIKNIDKIKIESDIIKQKEKFIKQLKDFEKDNNQRNIEERNKILIKIQNEVNKIALKEGFDIVIDASSIIFLVKSKDITEYVLKQIQ